MPREKFALEMDVIEDLRARANCAPAHLRRRCLRTADGELAVDEDRFYGGRAKFARRYASGSFGLAPAAEGARKARRRARDSITRKAPT